MRGCEGQEWLDSDAYDALDSALYKLRRCRPQDGSELDRMYQVVIADVERAKAYCKVFIVQRDYLE